MAVPLVIPIASAGITGARVAAPYIANLVRQYGPRVLDSVAGTGIGAYVGDKLFFGGDVRETPEGLVIGPELPPEKTLEDWKKENIEKFPSEPLPVEPLPGFNEGVTDLEKITGPLEGFGAGDKIEIPTILSTPPLKEEEKTPIIMTMAKGEKTLTPKEKEILDEFFEGPKEIIDSKKAKAKLGKNVDKRTGFDEHHLSYLADKFGLKKSDKELYGKMFTKGGNEVRAGWRRFMNWEQGLPITKDGKTIVRKSPEKDYSSASEKAAETKRKKILVPETIKEFKDLKKQMDSNALTLEEAILLKFPELQDPAKKSTKHYQIITKFDNFAKDIKAADEPLYDFFEREIENYKLGEVGTRKITKGSKELELWRKELSEKTGIPIEDLQRAHSIMQPRLKEIEDLYEQGKITKKEFQNLRRPQYLLLNPENQAHKRLENTLHDLLDRRFMYQQSGKKGKILSIVNRRIDNLIRKMKNFKVESTLFNPETGKLEKFGDQPGAAGLAYRFIKRKKEKTPEDWLYIKEMKDRMKNEGLKLNNGGIISINQLVRPL